jgi:hypothetical protein
MKDQDFMQAAESTHHLNEDFPYVVLLEQSVILLVITYLLKEITIVRILHDDTINFQ